MSALGRPSRGFSLVLVLLLVSALAVSAVATWRMAAGSQRVASGFRIQSLALQAAEAALRFCERQLLLADALRPASLQEASLPTSSPASPLWAAASSWRQPGLPGPPAPWLQPAGGSGLAVPQPVCLVERQALGSGQVHVVTVRGFSPDWRADAVTGTTVAGSVVWLQSVQLVHAGQVRDRVQRRLVQTPLR